MCILCTYTVNLGNTYSQPLLPHVKYFFATTQKRGWISMAFNLFGHDNIVTYVFEEKKGH